MRGLQGRGLAGALRALWLRRAVTASGLAEDRDGRPLVAGPADVTAMRRSVLQALEDRRHDELTPVLGLFLAAARVAGPQELDRHDDLVRRLLADRDLPDALALTVAVEAACADVDALITDPAGWRPQPDGDHDPARRARWDRAAERLERALLLLPDDDERVWVPLAWTRLHQGRFEEIRPALERAREHASPDGTGAELMDCALAAHEAWRHPVRARELVARVAAVAQDLHDPGLALALAYARAHLTAAANLTVVGSEVTA